MCTPHFPQTSNLLKSVTNAVRFLDLFSFQIGDVISNYRQVIIHECTVDDKKYILKIKHLYGDSDVSSFKNEVDIMENLQDYNLSPRVYYSFIFHDCSDGICKGVILMERLIVVDELIVNYGEIFEECIHLAMHISHLMISKHNILHGKYTWENIGIRVVDDEIKIIPFDFSKSIHITPEINQEIARKVDGCCLLRDSINTNIDPQCKDTAYRMLKYRETPTYSSSVSDDEEMEFIIAVDNLYKTLYDYISNQITSTNLPMITYLTK
jgi:hypothetical protein